MFLIKQRGRFVWRIIFGFCEKTGAIHFLKSWSSSNSAEGTNPAVASWLLLTPSGYNFLLIIISEEISCRHFKLVTNWLQGFYLFILVCVRVPLLLLYVGHCQVKHRGLFLLKLDTKYFGCTYTAANWLTSCLFVPAAGIFHKSWGNCGYAQWDRLQILWDN